MSFIVNTTSLIRRSLTHKGFVSALLSGYVVMASSIAVQFLFVPRYIEAFGKYQFGILMVLLNFVNFAVIGIAWMSGGSLRLLGEYAGLGEAENFRKAFGLIKTIYVGYGLILSALLGGVALFCDQWLFNGGTESDMQVARAALLLTGGYLIAFFAVAIDRIALIARKRQAVANISQLAGIVVFAVSVALWLEHGGDMAGVLGCQLLGALVSIGVAQMLLARELPGLGMRFPSKRDGALLRRLGGRTGLGFFLHGAIILALLADTSLVGWLGGAREAGEFFLVWKIAEVAVQVLWKLPEPLAPYFVQMDARGEHPAMDRIARAGYVVIGAASLGAGLVYAFFGHALVVFWVGAERAPITPLGYALAGGAIFWVGISRLPVVLAGARVALRPLNIAGSFELLGKLAISVCLFPQLGYLSVLLGINVVHLCGGSYLYYRLSRVVVDVPSSKD